MRRRSLIAGLLLSPAALAAGTRSPGPLRLSMLTLSPGLDPYETPQPNIDELAWLYGDGLIGVGPSGPAPLLLQSIPSPHDGTMSADGKELTYVLRPGIRWHDGKPLTAHDVVDAAARVKGSPWNGARPYNLVQSVDAQGTLAFRVRLKQADPAFHLSFFSAYGDPALPLLRKAPLPLGTGPFKVERFERASERLHLSPWAGSGRGRPAASGIDLRLMADPNTAAVTVVSGESDAALYVPHQIVEANRLRYTTSIRGVVYLLANAHGPLADLRLRQAVWAAIDTDEIRAKVYGAWGGVAASLVAPGAQGSGVSLRTPFDPSAARRIVSRLASKSEHLTVVSPPLDGARAALLIQQQLQAVGFTVTLQRYGVREYFAPDGPLRSGHFDIALAGETLTVDPDLAASFSCEAAPPNGGNFSRICDPAFDRALASGDVGGAMRELRRGAYLAPLTEIVSCIGIGPRVKSFRVQNYVPITYFCNEWSLK